MAEPLKKQSTWTVLPGGVSPLSAEQRRAVAAVTDVVRGLPPRQVKLLVMLVDEFRRDGYLERARSSDLPAVKILAEVISGWEQDGVYEFARAWVSTLVSRQDGFDWADCNPDQKQQHRRQIDEELTRRGLTGVRP